MAVDLEQLERTVRLTDVRIHKKRYAYLRCNENPSSGDHLMIFANSADKTVVTSEDQVESVEHTGIEAWYRLFEFQLPTPFQTPGFIAAITTSLSEAGLNVLVISSFVSDYILVKEQEMDVASIALLNRGFIL